MVYSTFFMCKEHTSLDLSSEHLKARGEPEKGQPGEMSQGSRVKRWQDVDDRGSPIHGEFSKNLWSCSDLNTLDESTHRDEGMC